MTRALSLVLLVAACSSEVATTALPVEQAALPGGLDLTVDERGDDLRFTVSGLNPFETVSIAVASPRLGPGACLPGVGCLDIQGRASLVGQARADRQGVAVLRQTIPASVAPGTSVGFQAVAPRGAASVGSDPVIYTVSDGLVDLTIVHAGADAPPVDVYANGALLLSNVSFGDSSGILEVPAGSYDIALRVTGSSTFVRPAFSGRVQLDANEDYTVVATGLLSSNDPADAFRLVALEDDWGPALPDSARVRILHASPDAPTVALDVFSDGSLDVPSLDRFDDTGPEGVALPSDTPFSVTVATPAGDKVTSLSFPALAEGSELTVLAIGQLGQPPSANNAFSALVLFEDGSTALIEQDPTIYVLHASPDAPPVDVRAGGVPLVEQLGFRELSAPIQVPPGSYDLEIAPTVFTALGLPGIPATTPTLEAGERYLVTATGFVDSDSGGEPFQLLYSAERFRRFSFSPSISFVHASPDAPAVDLGFLDSFNPLFPNFYTPFLFDVSFGEQTNGGGLELFTSEIEFGLRVTGDPVPAFVFEGVNLGFFSSYFLLATGSAVDGDIGLTLVDVTEDPWTVNTLSTVHP